MRRFKIESLWVVVLAIVVLTSAGPAYAENTVRVITGGILDVVVELELPNGEVVTGNLPDADGVITVLAKTGKGNYTITVSGAGTTESAVLSLGTGDIVNVTFDPGAPEGERLDVQVVFRGQDIIVTANKRTQQVQELPISVGVLTQDFVERENATQFDEVAGSVPGVQFQTAGGGNTRVTVRGISSLVGVATVGYYFDELPSTGFADAMPDFNLFDVERVEVLRGPQGTLFGEGSMGGTIRFITNKPDPNEFDVAVDLRGGSMTDGGNTYDVNAMVNIPLAKDKLALRITGYKNDRDGWIDNIRLGLEDVNTSESEGGRMALRWNAADNFVVDASVFYNEVHFESFDAEQFEGDQIDAKIGFQNDEYTTYALTLDWDLGWASLVSATSYMDRQADFDAPVLGFEGLVDDEWVSQLGFNTTEILAQEFRLVSTSESKLQWITGLYYRDLQRSVDAIIDSEPPVPGFLWPIFGALFEEDFEQMALFGEVTYFFSDQWQATGGIRYVDEELAWKSVSWGLLNGLVTDEFDDTTTYSDVVGKMSVAYQPGSNAMLYATVSSAGRSGGFNLTAQLFPDAPEEYLPDKTLNYELGAKTGWFNNRLVVNGAVYYIDWKDMQGIGTGASALFGFVTNEGRAHSQGIELELVGYPTTGLELLAGMSLIDAELDEPSGDAPVGAKLVGVPEEQFNIAVDYTFGLGQALRGNIRASWNKIGERTAELILDPHVVPGYELVNARLGVQAKTWEAYLYGTNLTNEKAIVNWDFFIGNFVAPPRTIGLNFRWRLR